MDGKFSLPMLKPPAVSLRTKTIVLLMILQIGFMLLLFVLSRTVLLDSFEAIEHDLAGDDLQRLTNVLADEFAELDLLAEGWANRGDMVAFVADQNQDYIDSNLNDATFAALRLNVMVFIDASDVIVFAKIYHSAEEREAYALDNALLLEDLNFTPLRRYAAGLDADHQHGAGVWITPHGPLMLTMQPVRNPDDVGAANGLLIMGRHLDEASLASLVTPTGATLKLYPYGSVNLPPRVRDVSGQLHEGGDQMIVALDEEMLGAYTLIDDITGGPALVAELVLPRGMYQRSVDTVYFFLVALFVVGLMLLAAAVYILERQILARVLQLNTLAETIKSTGNLDQRIPVDGQDELANLAGSMNGMLDTLQNTQQFLAENQRRTQTILTSISDVIYVSYVENGRHASHEILSPKIAELTGYPIEQFQDGGAFWQSLIVPEDRARSSAVDKSLRSGAYEETEYRITTADGTERWIRDSAHASTRDDGTVVVYGVLSDITSRKTVQERLAEREATARTLQTQFKVLLEVNVELSHAATLDELYRLAVELGHRRLGFERVELFLLEDRGATAVGTYAIASDGTITDARSLRRPVADDPAIVAALQKREQVTIYASVLGADGCAEQPHSSSALVPLWGANEAIGWLAIDVCEQRENVELYQQDVLSLFSTMVAGLIRRAQGQAALHESEAWHRALFEKANDAIFVMRDSVFVDCNSRVFDLFGYQREQIIGQSPYYFSPPRQPDGRNSREKARELLQLTLDGTPQLFEWRHVRADGTLFDAEISLSRLDIGEQGIMLALMRDITERKRAELVLRESEMRYAMLFDRMPVELYRAAYDGTLLDVNPALVDLLGYTSPDELLGSTMQRFFVNKARYKEWGELFEEVDEFHDFDVQLRRQDGRVIWALITSRLVRGESGEPLYFEGSVRDVTAVRDMQEALGQSQERLHLALQAAGLGLWDWDLATNQTVFSDRLAEIAGQSQSDLDNRPRAWEAQIHAEDRVDVNLKLQAHLSGETPIFEAEYRIVRPDGAVRWVLDRGKVMRRNAAGEPLRMTGTLGDITARKEAETEREHMLGQVRARANELATVADVGQRLTRILDIDKLLWELCDVVKTEFDLYHVHIYLLSDDGVQLNLAAGYGDAGRRMANDLHFIPIEHPSSLVARAARIPEVVVVNDVRHEAGFLPNPWLPETRAEMALPMVIAGKLVGVLDVQDMRVGRFSEQDMHIQTTLAAQLAVAVANARLFSENARRLALIEHSHSAIALIDANDIMAAPHYMNPAGLHMFGYDSLQDIEGTTIDDYFAEGFRHYLHNTAIPAVEATGVWQGEVLLKTRDGVKIPAEQTVFMIYDEQGKPRDIATMFTNIIERRRAEDALRRVNRAYRTLSECNQVMVGATDELGLLSKICEIIVTSGGYRMAWVGLTDVDDVVGASIQPVARAGADTSYLDRWLELREQGQVQDDPIRRAMVSREVVFVHDADGGEDFMLGQQVALEHGFRSAVVLPLASRDRVLGALCVYSDEAAAFDDQEIVLLSELASDLAYGIMVLRTRLERHVAIEQTQQLNRELALRNRQLLALYDAGRVLMATLDVEEIYRVLYQYVVQPVFGAHIMLVMSHDVMQHTVRCEFAIVDGEEQDVSWAEPQTLTDDDSDAAQDDPSSQTIHTGQPTVITMQSDAEALQLLPADFNLDTPTMPRAGMYIPMIIGGAVTGVIGVLHHTASAFGDHDVRMLSAIVNQAAVAIQNARLFAAERDQRNLVEALQAATAAVSSSLDPDIVLDRILANIQSVVPHDAASIMLVQGDGWTIAGHRGFEQYGGIDFGHTLDAMKNTAREERELYLNLGKPLLIEDTYQSRFWSRLPESDWIRSHIGSPIRYGDTLVGVLNLDSETPGFFTEQHARRAQAFADQVAVAVQNAQLFNAEREQRLLSDVLRDTAETLARSLEFDEVLDQILGNVRRVFPNDAANVSLLDEERGMLHVVRRHGYTRHGVDEWISSFELDISQAATVKEAAASRAPLIIPDVHADPRWIPIPELDWVRSHASTPIFWHDRLLGFLFLESATPGVYTDVHVQVLRILANQAAVAVQNAQLFTSEREQRRFAEALRDTAAAINRTLEFDRVLDFVLANAKRVVPHDAANIMLIEDGVAHVVRGHGYDQYGAGDYVRNLRFVAQDVAVWQAMLETGTPIVISDTYNTPEWPKDVPEEYWIRSTLKAPIRVEGRTIGLVHLDSETPGAFTQVHAERLQAFADQAAVALRNAEFFTAEHAQRTLAEALRDSASAVNSTLDIEVVLDRLLAYVGRVVPYDSANVLLIEDDEVRIAAQYPENHTPEPQKFLQEFRFKLHETPNLKQMFDTGEPVLLPDTSRYAGWKLIEPMEWIRSSVGAPIRHEGQVVGFITVDSREPGYFDATHAERLRAFADQTAIAIRNAQLFEAVQQHAAELEQRVAERAYEVEQQSAQLRAILDSITEGVIYDEKLAVKYTNRALTRLTGYAGEDFTRYLDILRSDRYTEEEFEQLIRRIFSGIEHQGVWKGDLWIQRQDQSQFEAALTVTEVRNTDGHIVGAVSVLRDVSQEKELQRQRDRFIASASHELRTPLTNFKTRLYLLKAQPEKALQHLTVLDEVADTMVDLVGSLLDVSRFERGVIELHRRRTLLQALVANVVEVQRAESERAGIDLVAELATDDIYASVDPARIRQVVTNLIANAINYTQAGGTITVRLERSTTHALLHVSDTGIGIDPEQFAHIFEPFFRANEEAAEGTGLGLTIAKEIVQLHDGDISVTSNPGSGSTFTVTLDLVD